MKRHCRSFRATGLCTVGVVFFFLTPLAMTQTITGTITGTVTDPSGGIVPNVRVTGTNTGTNLTYSTQTNEAGVYNLLFLPVGQYTVTVESSGFKKTVLGPFALEVAQVARVDIKLEVGE